MAFKLSIVIHIIGFTMLLAGIFLGLRSGREQTPSASLLKSIQFGYLLPGTVMVLLSGFYQLFYNGPAFYFAQSWFHGKLTSGILLIGVGLWLFSTLSKVQISGVPLKRSKVAVIHSVVGVLFFATVASVIIGR